jgi:hypothetical protein
VKKLQYLVNRLNNIAYKGIKRVIQYARYPAVTGQPRQHIFVAGMQRSGTNMMMDILDRSFETDVYHERDTRAFDNYRLRGWNVIHHLSDTSHARYVVIKALCESDHLHDLLAEFAPARAVWMIRNYEDVVNSMLVSFPNHARKIENIVTGRNPGDWVVQNMSPDTRALIRKLYHPEISDTSAAALIWYLRNVLYFDQGLEDDRRVRLIRYENAVTEPQISFKRLFDYLELAYSPRLVKYVSASSIKRRSEPDIEPAIREECEQLDMKFNEVLKKQGGSGA